MEVIKIKTGFNNFFTMDCVGRSGGLSLVWNNEAGIEIQNYSHLHINVTVTPSNGGES